MKIKNTFNKNKIFICYLILIVSISFIFALLTRIDNDYYWHIKAGEYMFKNKQILTNDIFSWFLYGKYWMSHEWLFEIIVFSLKNIFGNYHVFIYTFLSILTLFLILFLSRKKDYLKNIPFSLFWISISLLFLCYMQVRPHLISYIFLSLTVLVSYELFNNKNSKKIYFLPMLGLLWSNIHGGSSNLVYIIPFIFMVVGCFNFNYKKIETKRISKKQFVKYFLVIIISIVLICINPHGIKMLVYPYQNMNDSFMLKTISEWQPTNLNNLSHYFYIFILIFIFLILIFSKNKIKFIDLVLFGVCILLGLKSIRFWAYTYIIMNFCIFNYVSSRKPDKGTNFILLILFILIGVIGECNLNNLNNAFKEKILSDKAIFCLKEENPKRLYNYYDYGGYLIYNNIDVFVDGRADLYSAYNYKDYYNISVLNKDFDKLIKKYDFDYFIIPKKQGLSTYLEKDNDYKIIYHDKNSIIYKKTA